jgi:hypothetical protein
MESTASGTLTAHAALCKTSAAGLFERYYNPDVYVKTAPGNRDLTQNWSRAVAFGWSVSGPRIPRGRFRSRTRCPLARLPVGYGRCISGWARSEIQARRRAPTVVAAPATPLFFSTPQESPEERSW